ncbi:MAG TPA: ABC transporter permease, partial [Candidatus Omnitrophota bacterium]|nr:ABC transporter permease [Candidatus Omnitrophota bacterium]
MWTIFLSLKYLFSGRKERMISLIGGISVAGLALGVAALIIVLSIMNGFDSEIREKIIGTYSHVVVMADGGIKDSEELIEYLESFPGVKNVSPFITGQAILKGKENVTGILLKGIDPERESDVTSVIRYSGDSALKLGEGTIVLGGEMMKNERIVSGQTVELILPYSALDVEKVKLKVIGSFVSGRYDYDSNIGIVSMDTAQKMLRLKDEISGVGIKAEDGMKANILRDDLAGELGYPYAVKSWMDLDRNLVVALAVEKKMMFIILTIIVMVACFNIASSLIMMVMEKTRDIGILKAIGANSTGIKAIFLLLGAMIGTLGTASGAFIGLYVAERINDIAGFVEKVTGVPLFPSDVYYFTEIPVKTSMADVITVVSVAAALTLTAGIYPAW